MKYPIILLVVVFVLFDVRVSRSQAPSTLSVQGLLTDTAGVPLADGDYSVIFALYSDSAGGSELWAEIHDGFKAPTVSIDHGLFDVVLGSHNDLSKTKFDKPLYLGVTVEGDPEMTPRIALTAVPYARALPGMYTYYDDFGSERGYNVVGGDSGNVVDGDLAGVTIAGGGGWIDSEYIPNRVGGDFATVGGGYGNTSSSLGSTVGGGEENQASGASATVSGGRSNLANHNQTTIGGGWSNRAGEWLATVCGGAFNKANGVGSTIGGGADNRASEPYATIPGGFDNAARGPSSFAAGHRARANHEGTFVWNDRSIVGGNDSLVSTDSNQFIIRAVNGVGINAPPTNSGIYLKQQLHTGGYGIRMEISLSSNFWETYVGAGPPGLDAYFFNYNGVNKAVIDASSGAYTPFSDARLKKDIEPYYDVLASVAQLQPSTYRFKDVPAASPRSLGLVAQEVEPLFPELVSEMDGMKTLDYGGLSVVAIKAIQELYALTQEQGKQLAVQQAEIERLKHQLEP